MYPSGSAPARKSSSSDAVLNSFIYRYFESSFTCSTWWLLLRRSFFFASQIKNANLSSKFLVSCNVTSLFTNISFHETIDIAINLIFNHNPNVNITKKNLKNFSFLLHQTHFLFNSKFYNEIDGAAMGCLLAPVLANILMSFTNIHG